MVNTGLDFNEASTIEECLEREAVNKDGSIDEDMKPLLDAIAQVRDKSLVELLNNEKSWK